MTAPTMNRLRLLSGICALTAIVILAGQARGTAPVREDRVQLRSTSAPMTDDTTPAAAASSTIKWPVIPTTDPSPFDACTDIPLDVINRAGLGFTPPEHEDGLRCHFDAGNYQLAVESFIWRTYAQTLPVDAVEMTIDGHRAAQYWIMKPTDWNDRWWTSCALAFKTSWGVIQQTVFYSPIESPDKPDCLQTNLARAHDLVPYYKF